MLTGSDPTAYTSREVCPASPFGINPNSEIGMGSTGDSPVPSGHWPDGTGRTLAPETDVEKSSGAFPIPSGGSPLGTGQWPVLPAGMATAISEFGIKTVCRTRGCSAWYSRMNSAPTLLAVTVASLCVSLRAEGQNALKPIGEPAKIPLPLVQDGKPVALCTDGDAP